MKRRNARAAISSLTGRRIDSAHATGRAVKNALSRLRGWWYRGLRREIDGRRIVLGDGRPDAIGHWRLTVSGMRLDEEELRNLNNENLENELRESERGSW